MSHDRSSPRPHSPAARSGRRNWRLVGAACALAMAAGLAVAAPSRAQQTGTVSGTVMFDGSPLPDVSVFLWVGSPRLTCTDADGEFRFDDVPLGVDLVSATGTTSPEQCENYRFRAPDGRLLLTEFYDGNEGVAIFDTFQVTSADPGFEISYTPRVSPVGEAVCGGEFATIVGTPGDDVLTGGPGSDVIVGSDGDDTIRGRGGLDKICGGSGDDTIDGGSGGDWIRGGPGADVLRGGAGDDTLLGESGDDTARGNAGNDDIWGLSGRDTLIGDKGADTIRGGKHADTIRGGSGRDALHGQGGDDTIEGGTNDDKMWGNNGRDDLTGGRGIDTANGGRGRDTCTAEVEIRCP